jgi:CRP/FNR family transcriptional regulator, nitrogen fixation regulation protein
MGDSIMLIHSSFRATPSGRGELSPLLCQTRPSAITLFPEDAVIYAQGEDAGPLFLLEFGAVRICRLTTDGRFWAIVGCSSGVVIAAAACLA